MNDTHYKPHHWYWVRRDDGSLAPYLLHRVTSGGAAAEFYVGSMLRVWPLHRVVGEAQMPARPPAE